MNKSSSKLKNSRVKNWIIVVLVIVVFLAVGYFVMPTTE